MSLRRQSCEPCFKARRKCDLAYPVCDRCQKHNKKCQYKYHRQLDVIKNANTGPLGSISPFSVAPPRQPNPKRNIYETDIQPGPNKTSDLAELRISSVPKTLGHLGELSPVEADVPWKWLFGQIRNYPLDFARRADTVFIHRDLYGGSFPSTLRAAFGICAGCASMNEYNRAVVFEALDAEVSELFVSAPRTTLLEDLVKLQAAALYQIIRLFYGSIEQRVIAERQEFLVRSFGLRLLHRAEAELRDARRTWETWLLAESIRRTVLVAFKLYTVYSSFQYGICTELASVGILPVSTKSSLWSSREAYLEYPDPDETMPYKDFTMVWAAFPRKTSEPFDKFLLIGYKGIDQIEDPFGDQGRLEEV